MSTVHFVTLVVALVLFQSALFYGYAGVRALSTDERASFLQSAGPRWILLPLVATILAGVWVDDPLWKLLLIFLPVIIFVGPGFGSVKRLATQGFPADFVRRISRVNIMCYASAFGFASYVVLTVVYACACVLQG